MILFILLSSDRYVDQMGLSCLVRHKSERFTFCRPWTSTVLDDGAIEKMVRDMQLQ